MYVLGKVWSNGSLIGVFNEGYCYCMFDFSIVDMCIKVHMYLYILDIFYSFHS